jgi:uncharacterized protein
MSSRPRPTAGIVTGRLNMNRRFDLSSRASAFATGVGVATLGGLIGLGGAEFRLPALVALFGIAARVAAPINLAISFVTVAVSLAGRLAILSGGAMIAVADEIGAILVGSLTGAWFGVSLLRRLSDQMLHRVIGLLLLAIAAVLTAEAFLPLRGTLDLPASGPIPVAAGIIAGLGIGAVSSLLGVAGGELIIPTLVLAFAADIKTAGTASLIISLPTMLVGLIRHHGAGAFAGRALIRRVAAPMAAGSVIGALIGAALVGIAAAALIKLLLAAVLVVSGIKLYRHVPA